MTRTTILQRALVIGLAAAVAPLAFLRLTRRPVLPFDGAIHIDEDDLYDHLFDGEVAAAG